MANSSRWMVAGTKFDMSEFSVSTSRGSYQVQIGENLVARATTKADLVLIDDYVGRFLLDVPNPSTISVPGNEETKTLAGCEDILRQMNILGTKRGDVLVAVGGGAIQDAATLVASLYMRGIPWTYCPSTAMSMADSCIGGKSSINVAGIKNLVGNIYPPQQVLIDPSLAAGLPIEAKISGLGEAVKICFAAGESAFGKYLELAESPELFGKTPRTEDLLLHVLSAKKWFIEVDEFDRKERQLLNFGHTYAHALESASGFALPHGVAVVLGILGAISHPASVQSSGTEALKHYCQELLAPIGELVTSISERVDWTLFDQAVLTDKKGSRNDIRLVLPMSSGVLGLVSLPRGSESLQAIRESMAQSLAQVTT
jgi:3-dehydroquinate synthase